MNELDEMIYYEKKEKSERILVARRAFVNFSKKGDISGVKHIYSKYRFCINLPTILSAFTEAMKKGHVKVINWLMSNFHIDEDFLRDVKAGIMNIFAKRCNDIMFNCGNFNISQI